MSLFLTNFVNVLANFAIVLGVVRWYLALNKLWTRKHNPDVVGSLSTTNLTLGGVSIVLTLLDAAASGNLAQAATNFVDVFGVSVLFVVSVGVYIPSNEGQNFFALLWRSFRLERAEATNLLRTFTNPKGTRQIITLMEQLAAVDNEIAQAEIDLITQFTRAWGIEPPALTVGAVKETVSLMELRDSVDAYLAVEPPPTQAQQLLDLVTLLVSADNQVTETEQLVLDELGGRIAVYAAQQSLDEIVTYDVLLVPQTSEQRTAIRELLPDTEPQQRLGGEVFFVGTFYSEPFADAIIEKYRTLDLYATWDKVVGIR